MIQTTLTDGSRLLRVNNVARRLGVSERTVRWYAETRQIAAFKTGPKVWLFHEADVQSFKSRRPSEQELAKW